MNRTDVALQAVSASSLQSPAELVESQNVRPVCIPAPYYQLISLRLLDQPAANDTRTEGQYRVNTCQRQ